jgi:16S rRNA (guanine966-N2)-methyltransferase
VRIIAGQHRGLILADVGAGDAAAHLRPTSDRVRENLFNLIRNHGQPHRDTRVLDLFAGTGALGIEALSRGAAQVTFVDNGQAAQKLIRDNIARTRRQADVAVLTCDATHLRQNAGAAFDLIFLDPPYGLGLGLPALTAAQSGGWIADGGLVAWEERTAQPAPPGFGLLDQRRYGDTWITLLSFQPKV